MYPQVKNLLYCLLRWSERYTKTDMVYLAGGGFWLTVGQVGAALTAFAVSLVVARLLPVETYGVYKYILSLVAIIGAFSLTGFGTSIVRAIAKGLDGTLRYAFWTMLRYSAPMFLLFALVAAYYAWNGAYMLAGAVSIAALMTPLINSGGLSGAYWNGKKNFRRYTLYWSCANVASSVAVILTLLTTDSVIALVGAYFVTSAVVNVLLYRITVRTIPSDAPTDTSSLPYALHLSGINFLNTVSSQIDKIIVFQLLGTAQLAVYAFALALPDQVRALLKNGARLALPRYSERTLSDIQSSIVGKLIRFGVLIGIATALYIATAPFLYQFFFPAYIAAVPYSQFMALSLFAVLGTAPLTALQAHAKKRALYQHSVATNVIQIATSIFLISTWGLWGAAFSVLINRVVGLALPLYLLIRSGTSTDENSSLKNESMRK